MAGHNISICCVIFAIFSGLFILIDTKHHSKHHSRNHNLEDWEYEDISQENDLFDYSPEEEERPRHHKSHIHNFHDSDSEEDRPRTPPGNRHRDIEGRAAKPPKPPQSMDAFRAEGLKIHNELRAAHGSPPLQMDEDLNKLADEWAREIGDGSDAVLKIVLSHTPDLTVDGGTGDNIFACKCFDITGDRASRFWYAEEKKYNYSNPKYHWTWGHFTQLVWKESKKFGMAKYKTPILGAVIVVATYLPRGNMNYTKSFKDNVLPAIKKQRQTDPSPIAGNPPPDPPADLGQGMTNKDTSAPAESTNEETMKAGRMSNRGKQRKN